VNLESIKPSELVVDEPTLASSDWRSDAAQEFARKVEELLELIVRFALA
jgi:hypothetical protein